MGNRKYKRIPKKERRNQKLWAEGCHETILLPHVEKYADSMRFGWTAERDYFNRVCNEYHTLISWRLSDDEEPDLPLPVYNINAPPVVEELTAEEQVARGDHIRQKNKAIRRWLQYRVQRMKKIAMAKRVNFKDDPLALLMAKLSGVKAPPQKRRQGYQQYMHENQKQEIHPKVMEQWAEHTAANPSTTGNPTAAFRCKIAKELYNALPEDQKASLVERAEADRDQANAQYKTAMSTPPSQAPADRQRCINRLGAFFTPIFQGVKDFTGMHMVVLVGGCMPDQGGEIGCLTITKSLNNSPNPVSFAGWQPERYQKNVSALFEGYLQTCFTDEDKAAAALAPDDPLLQAKYRMDLDEDDEDMVPGHSDSDSNSSSSSDDNDDDVDSEEEAMKKRTKKRKRAQLGDMPAGAMAGKTVLKGTTAAKTKTTAVKKTPSLAKNAPSTQGLSSQTASPKPSTSRSNPVISEYERIRNENIAANQRLLDELELRHAASFISGKTKAADDVQQPRPKPRRRERIVPTEPPRRSTRGLQSIPSTEGAASGSGEKGGQGTAADRGGTAEHDRQDTENGGDEDMLEPSVSDRGLDDTAMNVDTGEGTVLAGTNAGSHSFPSDVHVSRLSSVVPPIPEPSSIEVGVGQSESPDVRTDQPGSPDVRTNSPDVRTNSLDVHTDRPDSPEVCPGLVDLGNVSSHLQRVNTFRRTAERERHLGFGRPALRDVPTPVPDVRNPGVDSGTPLDSTLEREDGLHNDSSNTSSLNVRKPAAGDVGNPPPLDESLRDSPSVDKRFFNDRNKESVGKEIKLPDNAPNWLRTPLTILTSIDLGQPFRNLIDLLIKLEVSNDFKNGKRGFPKAGRPAQLTVWIIDGRGRGGASTLVTNTESFGNTWLEWWISLQPKWRELESASDWPSKIEEYGDDWESLNCPGANGFLGVVACLYWWGCSVQGKVDGVKVVGPIVDWEEAVLDVGWTLWGMLACRGSI